MYTPFQHLSDNAHLWIYQASRQLAKEEIIAILQKTKHFVEEWTSHDTPLQGGTEVLYQQFLLLAVEKSNQSVAGCAVDTSIQFIRELEQTFQVGFLDRTNIAFKQGHTIFVVPFSQVKTKIRQREILAEMQLFDNTITQKAALLDQWCIRVKDAWLSKYLPK